MKNGLGKAWLYHEANISPPELGTSIQHAVLIPGAPCTGSTMAGGTLCMQESLSPSPPLWRPDQASQISTWTLFVATTSCPIPDPQGPKVDSAPFPVPEHPLSAKPCAQPWGTVVRNGHCLPGASSEWVTSKRMDGLQGTSKPSRLGTPNHMGAGRQEGLPRGGAACADCWRTLAAGQAVSLGKDTHPEGRRLSGKSSGLPGVQALGWEQAPNAMPRSL